MRSFMETKGAIFGNAWKIIIRQFENCVPVVSK